jgi:diguanylate cyclase (GGDEF)-like protein
MINGMLNFDPFKQAIRPKLLLVDDQSVNIRLLHEVFRNDCDIFMATSGQDALVKAREVLPDLILLDVVMPEMDGYKVCEILKNDPITHDIAIIFVSAHFEPDEEVRGFQLGAGDFIHKPINPLITQIRVKNQLSLKKQREFLHEIALTDGLTGVANRRRFNENYHMLWLQCLRENQPISVIMIDIDYFKKFNDHYGHQKGDDCLRKVAQSIKAIIHRPIDLLARYGGEEFICLLPKTDMEGANHLAAEMIDTIKNLNIPHETSEVSLVVTISAGVASIIPTANMDIESLVLAADKQLYRAKQNGRAQFQSDSL